MGKAVAKIWPIKKWPTVRRISRQADATDLPPGSLSDVDLRSTSSSPTDSTDVFSIDHQVVKRSSSVVRQSLEFEGAIVPTLWPLRVVGMFPERKAVGGYNAFAASLLILAWINAIRFATIFFVESSDSVGEITNKISFVVFYFSCAIMRTVMVAGSWSGKWQALIQSIRTQEIDAALMPDMKSVRISQLGKLCTGKFMLRLSIVFNLIWILFHGGLVGFGTSYCYEMRYLATPLHKYVDATNNSAWQAISSIIGLMTIVSQTGLCFGIVLIANLTMIQARKMMQFKAFLQKLVASGKAVSTQVLDLEGIRFCHLHFANVTKKFDRQVRYGLGMAMSYGFFGVIISLFNLVRSSDADSKPGQVDAVVSYSTMWMIVNVFYLLVSINIIMKLLISSATLAHSGRLVRDVVLSLPQSVLVAPGEAVSNDVILQMNLFLQQLTRPVALTYMGMVYMQKKTIIGINAALLTYFLILIEYSAWEQKMNLNLVGNGQIGSGNNTQI